MALVTNDLFCLSIIIRKVNGVGNENSDLATRFGGTFSDVESII